MAYLALEQVQGWLNTYKYDISVDEVDAVHEGTAVDSVLPVLEQRYDTSTWTDGATTPPMVVRIIAMLVASFTLRKAISEDDGGASYCNWLERRAQSLIDGLVSGLIDLPGVEPDPTAPAAGSVGFFPTDQSTDLWRDDPHAEGGTALYFDMQRTF